MLAGKAASHAEGSYSATLFSNATSIRSLAAQAPQLLSARHSTWDPRFFLASVSEKYWKARAVAVTCHNQLVGILYAKERLFCGFPTGIVYTDETLGMSLAAEAAHREHVLNVAIRSLLTSGTVRALRFILPRDEFKLETLSRTAASMDMEIISFQSGKHSSMDLPSTYDDFLNGVGARTRRNFRYYRRRFEASGSRYAGQVPFEHFCSAAWHLRGKSSIPADANGIKRVLKMLCAVSDPILVGLQASDGEWLSVAGGWCEHGRATLLFQLNNDREHQRDSVSQVLRSYLIEQLIARRTQDLVFWAGTSAPLARYAQRIPALVLYLDSYTPGWRLFRKSLSSIASRLPKRWREFGHWVTPETVPDEACGTEPSATIGDD